MLPSIYFQLYIKQHIMRLSLIILFSIIVSKNFAQNIISCPAVGGVTSSGARIFVKTATPQSFELQLATNDAFNNPVVISDSTRVANYGSVIINVNNLQAYTKYYYRFVFNGVIDSLKGSFKTFPQENDKQYLKIAVGSCNYFLNSPLFQSIKNFEPDFFIHLGDWNYVPSVQGFGWDYNLFPEKRAGAFPEKFNDINMKQYVLPFSGIDYIYDDDYSQNDSEGDNFNYDNTTVVNGVPYTTIQENIMPAGVNKGARLAYAQYFPGYEMADSSKGIFHSFKMGNAEIFMCDVRMARTPRLNAFSYDSLNNEWSFNPDTSHSILGITQRNWLINGLKNSTADWKIIGTGLVFNKSYKALINFGMYLQTLALTIANRQGSGMSLAYALATNWAGYPVDLEAVLNLKDEGVKNMIAISGDTHSSVMDDGNNAGIPELNASGLAAGDEAFLNFYIDSVLKGNGLSGVEDLLWNGGGNGVNNRNFSDSYGTIEIFGEDSLRMCVVDELNETLGCVTVLKDINNSSETKTWKSSAMMNLIYPNPSKDVIHVLLNEQMKKDDKDRITLYAENGQSLFTQNVNTENNNPQIINVASYSSGRYIISYEGKYKKESKTIVLSK